MPQIPTYAFQPAATPEHTVRADTGMYEPLNRGAQSIAGGISDIGQTASDFAQKYQAAQDFRTQSDTELALQQNYDDFLDRMKLMPDETKWTEEYEKSVKETLKRTAPKNKPSPRGQAQLDAYIAKFSQRTTAEVKHTQVAATIQRSRQSGINRMDQAVQHLDEDAYNSALQGLVSNALITPEEADAQRLAMAGKFDVQQSYRDAIASPAATIEALKEKTASGAWKNYTGMNEHQRTTAINNAEAQFHQVQQEAFDGINARHIKGEEIPESEIDAMVEQKLITKTQAAHITHDARLSAAKNPAKQTPLYLEAVDLISKYDPATATPQQTSRVLGAISPLVGPYLEDANKAFKEKRDPKSPQNTPAAKQAFAVIDMNFRNGVYGDYKQPKLIKSERTGKMVPAFDAAGRIVYEANPQKLEAAQAKKARIYDALGAYCRANPTATFEQLQTFLSAAQRSDVSRYGAGVFLQSVDFGVATQ